ncbi:2,3-bisphosphoglycerate-independent phosphoglycerate mutase [Halosquirtibacter xylanolyticus]|uniref:2,3-bisphosphoglycerate-independent phosphoglycerate mutase n=1 Tax=Halosquirtibacter xylanolyticus TaxID=3374599 RepID=UPI003749C231|nr:2,3-bisphosphoglycerate-independent phosphoglycerate mutase [Prolixibacteraceae bacterium]
MANTKKALLMILDGWGIGDKSKSDAIFNTPTPFIDSLIEKYPNSQLLTSGENVGLPDGQMGNSEVGHLNIGAGRVVYQDLVKINKAIEEDTLKNNEQIQKAYNYAKENNKNVHLIGLVGPGGVHALTKHMTALAEVAGSMGLENVYVHGLTDGRDTDPKSAYGYVKEALESLEGTPAKFVSLIGRYFGMDRDENWERVKLMYDQLTKGEGEKSTDLLASIQASYDAGVNDEFIKPVVTVDADGNAEGLIQEGDVVICYNYRTDRLRQLTRVFTQEDHSDFGMKTMDVEWYTMTTYNESFKGINVIFDKANITETLGEIVERAGLKQIRTAETEKFAHVTFFFSGGRESEFEGERRILVPSPKVATYDLQPEMSAPIVTGKLLPELEAQSADFICLNFANGDMVGHTGDYSAIEKAISSVDNCAKQVVETAQANGYDVVIIADHGNADNALNKDGSVNTAHSLNPVPFIWVTDQKDKKVKSGILADVAPTILNIMGLEIPAAMTGQVLIEE